MKSKPIYIGMVCFALIAMSVPATAQFDILKKKAEEKAKEAIEGKKQEAQDTSKTSQKATGQPTSDTTKAKSTAAGPSEDMTLYTKFDFVPGDRVIFYDDLSGEEIGEFPSRWRLDQGVFEVAKQGGKNYILCTDKGTIRPKIVTGPLPPKYTIEMEFYNNGGELKGHWFHIVWYNEQGEEIGTFKMENKIDTHLYLMGKELANKSLSAELAAGIHTMRVMATQTTMKCYVDNERVANVPAVGEFKPVDIGVYMDPWLDQPNNPMLVGTFRYAQGGKTMKEQLKESGRIVTHGILFDSGSDKIKGESYQTLKEIGQLLTDDPKLRLSIEGHTDSDGTDEYNMNLSQKRAASVRDYLVANYKIAPERLESKGWGKSKPIDTNNTPEGKANNRRVELVKL